MERAKLEKYERELLRLDAEYLDLEQHWQGVPRFFLFALSAPICWLLYGFGAGVVALLVSVALVGTRAYLIGIRKSENRWIRASVAREIEGDQEPARSFRALGS